MKTTITLGRDEVEALVLKALGLEGHAEFDWKIGDAGLYELVIETERAT